MFSRDSRYRAVPEVTAVDRRGRVIRVKDVRPLPVVTGTYRAVVHAGDRLDQLATTYFGRPSDWWHLCDANPEVLFPFALVGAHPVVTTEFPLPAVETPPPWHRVFRALSDLPGVEEFQVVDDLQLVPRTAGPDGDVTVWLEEPRRAVRVTHNRARTSAVSIAETLRAVPLAVGPFVELGRVGQEIVVPPPVAR